VKIKAELHTDEVARIRGLTSLELAERCPDLRTVFPRTPCSNGGCDYSIHERAYMNCMFVASEAGEHTLEAIGKMMGVSKQGVKAIEVRALLKVKRGT
jgi:hypothetical protein